MPSTLPGLSLLANLSLSLESAAKRIRTHAHQPGHFNDLRGVKAAPLGPDHKYTMKEPGC